MKKEKILRHHSGGLKELIYMKFNEKPDIFAFIGLSFIIIGIIILVSLSKMGAKIS